MTTDHKKGFALACCTNPNGGGVPGYFVPALRFFTALVAYFRVFVYLCTADKEINEYIGIKTGLNAIYLLDVRLAFVKKRGAFFVHLHIFCVG